MKTNESGLDRIIRVITGAALLALYFTHVLVGGLGIVTVIIGAVLLITGAVGFCPIYSLIKIQTNKKA
jgi:hypothetical protein